VTFVNTLKLLAEPGLLDFNEVANLLAQEHWCKGMTAEEASLAARNSALVVSAFMQNYFVGYLRVVSDRTCFAYILDVVVAKEYRKQGIGQEMVRFAMAHERLKHVYQWMIRTPDAQDFYAKLGFRKLINPEQWMLIQENRPKRDTLELS
jgi:ribosomal protein S18 acetylase RimI-like enzyme